VVGIALRERNRLPLALQAQVQVGSFRFLLGSLITWYGGRFGMLAAGLILGWVVQAIVESVHSGLGMFLVEGKSPFPRMNAFADEDACDNFFFNLS